MQGQELFDYIQKTPALSAHFKGVFAINTIPPSLKKRHFFFCNTDVNTGDGIHWQCVLKNDENQLEYFDSLGFTDEKLTKFAFFCKIKAKSLLYNKTRVQEESSDTCGLFCLYFIIHRLFNLDLTFYEVLNDIFSNLPLENEISVKNFVTFQ